MPDQSETLEYRVAIREAIAAEMERDETVVFFGEDVAIAGGVFAVTPGLYERFGDRVIDTSGAPPETKKRVDEALADALRAVTGATGLRGG